MLRRLLEPFVWVIGVAGGTTFLSVSFCIARGTGVELIRPDSIIDVASLGLFVANVFAIVWIVLYFGARRFRTALGTLYWSFLASWLVAGILDTVGGTVIKNVTPEYSDTAFIGFTVAVVLVNLYAVTRTYRYSRIAKAAALAEDEHPFAGWDTKPMKVMGALILVCGMAEILGIVWVH